MKRQPTMANVVRNLEKDNRPLHSTELPAMSHPRDKYKLRRTIDHFQWGMDRKGRTFDSYHNRFIGIYLKQKQNEIVFQNRYP